MESTTQVQILEEALGFQLRPNALVEVLDSSYHARLVEEESPNYSG